MFGKTVTVNPIDQDRYGRTVGVVTYDGMNLNVELVCSGYAWVYDQYCTRMECREWNFIEAKARGEKNGLWSMPNPVPPWEFRHPTGRSQSTTNEVAPTTATGTGYHGNSSSMVFHQPSCKHYNCKNCTVSFQSQEEAIAAGFKPCGICKP